MIEYLKHELTHELQTCTGAADATCADRMKREIEAYKSGEGISPASRMANAAAQLEVRSGVLVLPSVVQFRTSRTRSWPR